MAVKICQSNMSCDNKSEEQQSKTKYNKYARTCIKTWKTIYCILTDNVNRWRLVRGIFSYFAGILSALFFWQIFIINLNFLGPGFTFSKRIRCIICLIYLGCLGKSGRSYLRALFFALVISGPITNMVLNTKEVVRVFACATILTYNLTKTRFDLMTKPFTKAVILMKDDMHQIKDSLNEIESIIEPIRSEIEDEEILENFMNKTVNKRQTYIEGDQMKDDDEIEIAIKYQKMYEEKFRRRCEMQFEKGKNKCIEAFAQMYDKCMEMMPIVVNYLLCWPMKIDLMCHMSLGTSEICDPKDAINSTFGETYSKVKEIGEQFSKNITNVKVNYTVINPKNIPGVISAQETGERVVKSFNAKIKLFEFCIEIINRILAFIFVRLVINSYKYNKMYLKNIDFDNLYITNYFKKIDERRKTRNNHTLLPLKKFERNLIIDPEDHSTKTKAEKSRFFINLLKFLLELSTVIVFLLLDYIFYYMLNLIRKHSKITYHQSGSHNLNFHINGTGLIAKLLRSSLLAFNTNESISTFLSNEPCLPKPYRLEKMFYTKFWGLVILIIILIYHEIPLMRTRRLICCYFYPKREKKRILHLYNSMLKRRRIILGSMRNELLEKCQKYLRLKFPKQFTWLMYFKYARRKCLICNEMEQNINLLKRNSKNLKNFETSIGTYHILTTGIIECPTKNCNVIHCKECWRDIGEICLACSKQSA
ncbi:protein sneaky [Condylostylus longicornis]|uniref:protein sneaky n=1 Tax=Condylostylus longicornis TaxID=2530218 RepID=UPI00244E4B1D|nr:protein sneaky [Condylostylus longicornis]